MKRRSPEESRIYKSAAYKRLKPIMAKAGIPFSAIERFNEGSVGPLAKRCVDGTLTQEDREFVALLILGVVKPPHDTRRKQARDEVMRLEAAIMSRGLGKSTKSIVGHFQKKYNLSRTQVLEILKCGRSAAIKQPLRSPVK